MDVIAAPGADPGFLRTSSQPTPHTKYKEKADEEAAIEAFEVPQRILRVAQGQGAHGGESPVLAGEAAGRVVAAARAGRWVDPREQDPADDEEEAEEALSPRFAGNAPTFPPLPCLPRSVLWRGLTLTCNQNTMEYAELLKLEQDRRAAKTYYWESEGGEEGENEGTIDMASLSNAEILQMHGIESPILDWTESRSSSTDGVARAGSPAHVTSPHPAAKAVFRRTCSADLERTGSSAGSAQPVANFGRTRSADATSRANGAGDFPGSTTTFTRTRSPGSTAAHRPGFGRTRSSGSSIVTRIQTMAREAQCPVENSAEGAARPRAILRSSSCHDLMSKETNTSSSPTQEQSGQGLPGHW